jgi:hypothetical protein
MSRRVSSPKYVKFGPTETVVTFATDRGSLRRNDSGEFFFRELTDGRFTCASPDLERQLIDAGVRAGQPIGITRTLYNRCVTWKVRAIGQVAEMPSPVPASTTRKPKANAHELPERLYAKPEFAKVALAAHSKTTGSCAPENIDSETNGRVALVASSDGQLIAAPVKSEPPAPVFPECEPAVNGAAPTEAAQPQADSPTLIMRCMVAAVDAAAKATAHGQQIGFPVAFGPGEIERIAVTLYINSAQPPFAGPPRYSKPNGQARSHYNGQNGSQKTNDYAH